MINRIVEYKAKIFGVMTTTKLDAKDLDLFSDSRLLVNQYTSVFMTKVNKMRKYLERLRHEFLLLGSLKIHQISHSNNRHIDALAMFSSIHGRKIYKLVTITIPSYSI